MAQDLLLESFQFLYSIVGFFELKIRILLSFDIRWGQVQIFHLIFFFDLQIRINQIIKTREKVNTSVNSNVLVKVFVEAIGI